MSVRSSATYSIVASAAATTLLGLAGCFHGAPDACDNDGDCFRGEECVQGVCRTTGTASGDTSTGGAEISSLVIEPKDVAVQLEESVRLRVRALDDSGQQVALPERVRWRSSDADIARIEPPRRGASVTVRGVETGAADITVRSGDLRASAVVTVQENAVNNPPVAEATVDTKEVQVGAAVQLDASGSTDPDDDNLSYEWSLAATPNASNSTVESSSAAETSFTPDVAGSYVVELVVRDGRASASDSVDVVAQSEDVKNNSPPTANAGDKQVVVPGETAHLDASGSSDPDGDGLTFDWVVTSAPGNSSPTIQEPNRVETDVEIPYPGEYEVQLSVSDGMATDTDTVQIIGNKPPTAEAGSNRTVNLGETVTLDGTNSSDLDDDQNLTYSWSFYEKPSSSAAVLSGANKEKAQFAVDVSGTYGIELIVDDGTSTDKDRVEITGNRKPIAEAGSDKTVNGSDQVTFDASNSTDPDGQTLSYKWTFVSVPSGSAVTDSDLIGRNSVQCDFTPPDSQSAVQYELELEVDDGYATDTDRVTLNVE